MSSHRVFFTPSEDAKIIKFRAKYPDAPWSDIAKKIKGKTAKQCNDRYNKHLKQAKNNSPWTEEEDERLTKYVDEHGHNWVLVSKLMGNRSNIEAKNRWTVLERMRHKKGTLSRTKTHITTKKNNYESPQQTIYIEEQPQIDAKTEFTLPNNANDILSELPPEASIFSTFKNEGTIIDEPFLLVDVFEKTSLPSFDADGVFDHLNDVNEEWDFLAEF